MLATPIGVAFLLLPQLDPIKPRPTVAMSSLAGPAPAAASRETGRAEFLRDYSPTFAPHWVQNLEPGLSAPPQWVQNFADVGGAEIILPGAVVGGAGAAASPPLG